MTRGPIHQDLIDKRPWVERYLQRGSCPLSGYSFVNIFLWKDFFEFRFIEIDGNLCVMAGDTAGTFLYLPPLGDEISPRALDECFKMMARENAGSLVTRVENVAQEQISCFPEKQANLIRKSDEYVYRRAEIAALVGNAFKSKRAEYNQCSKNYRPFVSRFEPAYISECLGLYERWAAQKVAAGPTDMGRYMIEDNRGVHRLAMENAEELGLVGRVVMIEGKVRAYTFGYQLDHQTFCVLFEIAEPGFKGLATFTFVEFCRDHQVSRFDYINAMDDFGLENVRKTKLSFRPWRLLPVYIATPRDVLS